MKKLLFAFLLLIPTLGRADLIGGSNGGTSSSGGGGSSGTSNLAVGVGGPAGFTILATSPTGGIIFDTSTFQTSNFTGTTAYLQINSSVTKQGVITATNLGAVTGVFSYAPILNTGGQTPLFSLSSVFNSSMTFTSSVTVTGIGGIANTFGVLTSTIQVSSNTVLSGTTFYQNGPIVNGNTLISPTQVFLGTSGSSVVVNGNEIQNAAFYPSTATSAGTANIQNGQFYFTGCMDSVILASAPVNTGIKINLELPTACPNHHLTIYKVDQTTNVVTIISSTAASGYSIDGSTQVLTLNTVGQHDELIAGGSVGWLSYGGGLQVTPPMAHAYLSGTGSFTVGTSSNIITCPFYLSTPVTVTGYRFDVVTVNSGFIAIGILDQFGNVLTSTGSQSGVHLTGTGVTTINYTGISQASSNLPPGQYYLAYQANNVTTSVIGAGNGTDHQPMCGLTGASSIGIVNVASPGSALNNVGFPEIAILVNGGRTQ